MISTKENLLVLYEDNHMIVVNKRVGDIVQGDKTGDIPLSEIVKEYLKNKYDKKGAVYLGVPHRLDRPTSGIVIFAKTSKVLPRLNKLFSEKEEIEKIYWALVEKKENFLKKQLLKHWLTRNTEKNTSRAHFSPVQNGKEALLEYEVVQELDNYYLLEIQLLTGRHHQIRAQLSAIGSPIKGDVKYGAKRTNLDGGISLHAREIRFIHPVSKEKIHIKAPIISKDTIWQQIVKNENT